MPSDDDEITCERCGRTSYSWSAEACTWWPTGCQGTDWRICWDCATPKERREVADAGCSKAAFLLG